MDTSLTSNSLIVILLLMFMLNGLETTNTSYGTLGCELGQYLCFEIAECIDKSSLCDGTPDCKDGTDEAEFMCKDRHQDEFWNNVFQKRPDADKEQLNNICDLKKVPERCTCKQRTKLFCKNVDVSSFQSNRSIVTELHITESKAYHLSKGSFENMRKLSELYLMHNSISTIEPGTLSNNFRLRILYLDHNLLQHFDSHMFSIVNQLGELHLDYNLISVIEENMFVRLRSLTNLYIRHNRIRRIESAAFRKNKKLMILFLSGNKLLHIDRQMFVHLPKLQILDISDNRISRISDAAFASLTSLQSLSLRENDIKVLTDLMFFGLSNLTFLDLTFNQISIVKKDTFRMTKKLASLDMRNNPFKSVPDNTFREASALENIYFDNFFMCIYALNVKKCEPNGDGISSKENLLENPVLRVSVWIVALLACICNVLVFLGRFVLRRDNKIHSFYIQHLSLADLLMGIYLLILGSRDMMYRGHYIFYDMMWRSSDECNICGILCTLSSEVSVFTLAVITRDRYISIIKPLNTRNKNLSSPCLIMTCIWIICIGLSVLPITGINYFGNSFYRNNGVCVPLHLHDPKTDGWEYSSFIFLGINGTVFLLISFAYTKMFVAIKRSTISLRTHGENKERQLAKRFFFIVFSDFLCWAPIMAIKIAALSGADISGDLYAWIVVFILPVNSALNPLLYTLTTRMFKEYMYPAMCCMYSQTKHVVIERSSSSSTSGNHKRSSRKATLEKDLRQVGVHTLSCASSPRVHTVKPRTDYIELKMMSRKPKYLCYRNRIVLEGQEKGARLVKCVAENNEFEEICTNEK